MLRALIYFATGIELENDLRLVRDSGGQWIAQRKRWWFPIWIRTGKETEARLITGTHPKSSTALRNYDDRNNEAA